MSHKSHKTKKTFASVDYTRVLSAISKRHMLSIFFVPCNNLEKRKFSWLEKVWRDIRNNQDQHKSKALSWGCLDPTPCTWPRWTSFGSCGSSFQVCPGFCKWHPFLLLHQLHHSVWYHQQTCWVCTQLHYLDCW